MIVKWHVDTKQEEDVRFVSAKRDQVNDMGGNVFERLMVGSWVDLYNVIFLLGTRGN